MAMSASETRPKRLTYKPPIKPRLVKPIFVLVALAFTALCIVLNRGLPFRLAALAAGVDGRGEGTGAWDQTADDEE